MGQTEPDLVPFARPPRLSGRYVVSRLIGKGAQARVYLAFDGRLKQWRAIKVLAPNFLDDPQVRARFEQEAQAMARLSHPNLLRVVDVDHDGRTPYMVMEVARGGTVTEWMKRHGPIPAVLACRITQACCEGLAHAHAQNVVHRDVKPHNVLIREDGSLALTDFGIARIDEGDNLTATGTIMGTFAFMAPEQRTDSKAVDLRADVYSLGATLYTMLTARTSAELFFAESRDALLDGVPEALRSVILTACRYEREQRYISMFEFRDALERRIPRLPADPRNTELVSSLLPLPPGPPEWVEPASGVEELRQALLGLEDGPTLNPADPVEPSIDLVAFDPTPLVQATPYRMPGTGRSPGAGRRGGRPDDVPDYVDVETLRAKPVRQVEIDDTGARSFHAEEPVPTGRSPIAWAAVAAGTAVGLLVALILTGFLAKVYTSYERSRADEALIHTAHDERLVIADLVAAGADEALLQDRFYQFQDAVGDSRTAAAASFAEAVAAEAERTDVQGLALSHVSQLVRARRDWIDATRMQDVVEDSLLGRMTGSLGVW